MVLIVPNREHYLGTLAEICRLLFPLLLDWGRQELYGGVTTATSTFCMA